MIPVPVMTRLPSVGMIVEPDIQWLPASACLPPHGITHPEKALQLHKAFLEPGWDLSQPVLVGYPVPSEAGDSSCTNGAAPYGDGIQLLSGSHRWAAAAEVGIRIPVHIVPYEAVEWSYGHLERWAALMSGGSRGPRGE